MILPVDTRFVERQRNRVQFDVRVAREATDSFVSIGLIDGELDDFITIEAIKSEGSQTFANGEGFLNTIRFMAATQTLLNNTSIANLENLDKGLWYLQFKAVYGTLNFVTPNPVSLKVTGRIRTGNAKSQSAMIETFFFTKDLNWIKDARPTRPILIKPPINKRTEGDPPFPFEASLNLDDPLVLRVSNPAIPENIRPLVVYDVFIYNDKARTEIVASKTNIPTADIEQNDYTIDSDAQLTHYSDLVKGKRYFATIKARYIGLESLPLTFSFTYGLDAPSFDMSLSPQNGEIPAIPTTWKWNEITNATAYEFEYQFGSSTPEIVERIGVSNTTYLLNISSSNISSQSLSVRVRARNPIVYSEWSSKLNYTLRDLDFTLSINGAGDTIGNPIQILQGQKGTITININRPESGTEPIKLTNNNVGLPSLNLPYQTSGTEIQREVTVGMLDRTTYSPQITGKSPNEIITRTATYYVSVKDLRDAFDSGLVVWFKAEDLTLGDNANVVEWSANARSFDFQTKWQQLTAAQQPKFRTAESANPNPFRNLNTPYGTKSYPSVLIEQANRMDLKSDENLNKNLDFSEVSIYIAMAMKTNPSQTRVLMCDKFNPTHRAVTSFGGIGVFYAGFDYGSSLFAFNGLGENVIGLWSARWKNNGENFSTDVTLRRNTSIAYTTTSGQPDVPALAPTWRLNRLGGTTDTGITSSFPYYLAELIVFNTKHTDVEAAKVYAYFYAKYGIPF